MEDLLELNERSGRRKLANIYYTILLVILIAILIITQLFSISEVSGESMRETIQSGDFIVVFYKNKFDRGDIVTAYTGEIHIVKRVIGVPGDRIVFVNNGDNEIDPTVSLYIDSGSGFVKLDEPYIRHRVMHRSGFIRQDMFAENNYRLYNGNIANVSDEYIITVGKKEYFLMGDNRDESRDSRNYGLFTNKDIMGKVTEIVSDGYDYTIISVFYQIMDWLGLKQSQ